MEQTQLTRAVRYAKHEPFQKRVDYAQIERFQAGRFPELKSKLTRRMAWLIVTIVCSAAVIGATAATGPGGYVPGIRGSFATGVMGDDTRAVFLPLSFALSSIGMIMWGVTWLRTRRLRDLRAVIFAILAIIVCAATLNWIRINEPDDGPLSLVLIVINGVLAIIVLCVELFASRGGDADFEEEAEVGRWLTELDDAQRRSVREEREQIVDVLLERGQIDQAEAARVRALPEGELWKAGHRYRRRAERRARKGNS